MAKFFNTFPRIDYTYGDIKIANINDITIRVDIVKSVLDRQSNFEFYDVQDGETPEIVAYNFYNDTNLHWIILMTNDMIGINEWPLSNQQLEKSILRKYPNNTDTDTHHYQATVNNITYDFDANIGVDGNIATVQIDGNDVAAAPVTNRSFETTLNDDNRAIKLLRPEAVTEVYAELKRLVENGNN